MKYILSVIAMLMTFTLNAQPEKLLEISAESFHPVQTDAISGVPIDKIGMDPSKRPCARIKMHINRMTRDEIEGVSVRPIGGSVVVTKRTLSAEGNGLVIELTAKEPTRFYLHHPKYGDSNEVSLNLEGNKEYRIDARLNTTYSIVVSSNKPESEVYLDGTYKGQISNKYDLTISDVYPGPHRIKVISGSVSEEQSVEVNSSNIHFRIILNLESAAPQYVAFMVNPKDANLIIDNRPYMLNKYGEMTEPLMLNNGTYTYAVFAKDYHEERGTFTVSGAKVEKHVNLRPAYGLLKVSGNGNLNGASIYVDDKLIGQAPITSGRLSSGEHTIRISKQLYKDYIGKIYIYDDKTTECNPELTADFATVTLSSEAGSEIYVNGNLKGKSPWTGNLRSGVYNFEARLTGHSNSTISKTISAVPSVQSYAIPSPTPILEKVDFISSPMADVYIDGKHIGRTPLSMNLIIGKHTVSFKKDGFQTQDRSFEVKDGIPSTVKVTLNEVCATSSKPITGAFKDITIEHNVMKDGVKGMKILVDFEVQNMKDISGACVAYFYYKDGTRVKGKTSKFQTVTGEHASALTDIKPKYDNTIFTDLEIFMPYSELDVSSGKHELKFHCTLWEHKESWKEVATSQWYEFNINPNNTNSSSLNSNTSKPITGAFKDITIDHNVMKDGVKGMKILVDFEVQNMKDISGSCDAYFYYKDGTRVKGKTSKFQTQTGNSTAIRDIKPKYDNTIFTDLEIFMPYSELDVSSGKHELKFHCTLWEHKESWKEVATSGWYDFNINKSSSPNSTNSSPLSSNTSKPITGAFKDITIEHNVMKDGVKGMKILVDFEVQNMKDISGSCDAYFYYKDGTRVKGKTSKFQTQTGNATAIRDIKPKYDNTIFTDLEIFMPYSELDVSSGKHELKFRCTLWEHKESWKDVATSRWYDFTLTR